MTTRSIVSIAAPRDKVWRLVTDIEHSTDVIEGIEEIEILERPIDGLVGLKWRETRTLFGKKATETMWISDASEPEYYATAARSHGSFYRTEVRLEEEGAGTRLSMVFEAKPESAAARLMYTIFGPVMKRSIRKALLKDLQDVKRAAESQQDPV